MSMHSGLMHPADQLCFSGTTIDRELGQPPCHLLHVVVRAVQPYVDEGRLGIAVALVLQVGHAQE